MFGSTSPFGQSSTSLFGQSPFRTAQQGFEQATAAAVSNPFAPKPFGSPITTSGAQTGSSPLDNTSGAFGQQQSTPTFGTPFGSSTPAFGASPTPAFGATSSTTFGSGSVFGQKPSFGSFGSSPSQSTPFGTPFGSSTPAFGAPPTPAFGATSSTFGSGSLFGQKPSFGSFESSPNQKPTPFGGSAFQQTQPTFGSTTFGAKTTPAAFGAATTPAFGTTTTTPAFGATPNTAFGSTPTPLFGATSTPAFGSTAFGSSTPGFGNSGTTSFGASSLGFGVSNTPTFGQSTTTSFGSSSSLPVGQPTTSFGTSSFGATSSPFGVQSSPFGGPSPSGTPTAQPNPFSQVNPSLPFPSPPSNPFAKILTDTSSTSTFTNTTMFGSSGSVFPTNSSPSLFSNTNAALASSPLFSPSILPNQNPFSTGVSLNTQSVGLFASSPASVQLSSSTTAFSSSSSGSLFSSPTLFGSGSSPFSSIQSAPAQTSSVLSFQPTTQPALGGFSGISNTTSQSPIGQLTPSQSNMVFQPALTSHPHGTLPAMPQMSTGNAGSSPSVQYGISSLPAAEKPLPSRTSSMVVPRHLSQRRIRLHPRKCNLLTDGKVPFFADDEKSPATPKADVPFFIPRENPRNLMIGPTDQRSSHNGMYSQSVPKDSADPEKYKGVSADIAHDKTATSPCRCSPVEYGNHLEPEAATQHGNRAASVERLMPKLPRAADYFTEPSLEELATNEQAEPGYCSRVRDFVVGRHGYGSIKFLGDTDVRGLDMESTVEFKTREVTVYKDDSKKPPVGEGLNKAAEVTLLNVRCMDNKTGEPHREGPKVDRYREMLVKMARKQGAEFVSFDPAEGEWRFRVKHFSAYGFR